MKLSIQQESDNRFRQLVESLPQLVWTCSKDGSCDYLSPQWVKYTGIPESEQLGMGWLNQLHPDDRERTLAAWSAAAGTGSTFDVEFRIRRSDGVYRWFSSHAIPLHDKQGEVTEWFGTNTDIEDFKRSEDNLIKSEGQYRSIISSMTSVICRFKADGTILFVNEVFCRFFGLQREGVIGKKWQPRAVPEDVQKVEECLRRLSPANPIVEVENRVYSGSGEVHWMHFINHAFFDAEGRLVETQGVGNDITERKQAEEQLSTLSRRLELATSSAGLGIWDWDVGNNIMVWDDRMLELYGLTRDTFPGGVQAWQNGLHPEDQDRAIEECQAALRGGKEYKTEFRVLHPDGKVLYIKAQGLVVRGTDGKAVRMIGANADITGRKQAEEALSRTNELLERTGEMAKVGGWELDLQTQQVTYSKETVRIHEIEYPYDQPKYSQGNRFYSPEAWSIIQASVQAAIDHGTPYDLESPFITGKGRHIWVRVQGFPVRENGKTIKLRGTFQDITERKQAEERARESEASYRLLFDKIADGIVIVDSETKKVLHANPAMCQMLGYTSEEMEAMDMVRLHPLDARPFILKGFEATGRGDRLGILPLELLRKNGEILPAELSSTTDFLMGRKCNMAIFRDITLRKQAEDLVRNMTQKLERLVEIRTLKLSRANENLQKEKKQRLDLEREVVKISESERSRIGHDLHDSVGQAIAGIGYLISATQQRLARKGVPESAELARVAEIIEKNVKLVRQIAHNLYPSELENEGLIGALQKLALNTQNVWGIACRVSATPELKIRDKQIQSQFYRIVQEAVNNAAKHSGTKLIIIRLYQKRKNLIITVKDAGIGISRKNRAVKGLGTRIMKYRAEMIGATLKVASVRGKGTTVTCVWPVPPVRRKTT